MVLNKSRSVKSALLLRAVPLAIITASICTAAYAQSPAETVEFDLPAQSLEQALKGFSVTADKQLMFATDIAEGKTANRLSGEMEPMQALDVLLDGTGLVYETTSSDVILVKASQTEVAEGLGNARTAPSPVLMAQVSMNQSTESRSNSTANNNTHDYDNPLPLEEIIVTGTSIRGVSPESSPLAIYDALDIRNTGALTAEQFIATLPQNNNTLSEVGGGSSIRDVNTSSTNSVDIRGLGVGSTLVLLNGRRMAPSSAGRTTDISFVPIGMVERVEVLTDGASAIYGADAIGGVVNFVLRDQQDSAETVLTFGVAEGGSEQWRIDQSFGFNWADGNALIALSYMDRNALDAADRDFSLPAGEYTLVPEDTRKNVLATVSQLLPGDFTISADLLYSAKEPRVNNTLAQFTGDNFITRSMEQEQTVLNLAVERSFGERLSTDLLVTYADSSADATGFEDGPVIGVGPYSDSQDTTSLDITAKVDGELARFSSGALMFALGAGYREDEFEEVRDYSIPDGVTSDITLDRNLRYAFAELLVPLASPGQNITGLRRLELSLSARYEDYSDFGDGTSPKIGVLWSPVEQLNIRGTFGESFKAPTLMQLNPVAGFYALYPTSAFTFVNDIWSTDNSSTVLFSTSGTKPGLGPEEAGTYTFGFDLDVSDLTVNATYFNIDYTDRISQPDTSAFASLATPQNFNEIYHLNPTLDQITEVLSGIPILNFTGLDTNDPAAVLAGITVYGDNRKQNLSISEVDGLDLRINYTTEIYAGELNFGMNATKVFSFEDRIFASSAPITRSDTVLYPADLKVRTHLGFGKDRWSARLNVNYVDEYDNPFDAANPTVDDWTTVDLLFSYEFPIDGSGFSDGLRLGLTIQNVLDEDPPFVAMGPNNSTILSPIGFDPANASPLGRFITVQISKSW